MQQYEVWPTSNSQSTLVIHRSTVAVRPAIPAGRPQFAVVDVEQRITFVGTNGAHTNTWKVVVRDHQDVEKQLAELPVDYQPRNDELAEMVVRVLQAEGRIPSGEIDITT